MADRLFRILLKLLPEEFRSAYARDMEATFRAERRSAGGHRRQALALWAATLGDILRHAPAEHADILRRDTRLAFRTLAARPLATFTAVLTLAIALGANVAMYAVVNTVLLSPLPYRNADSIVTVSETRAGADASNLGYLTFVDLKNQSRNLTTLVAATQSTATLTGGGRDAERVNAMRVSREYFDLMGVTPALGRTFTAAEDQPGAARRVVVLSDALWRRRFNADPTVIDRVIDISGIPFRIVGVLPQGFKDLVAARMYQGAEIWYPLGYDPVASFACRTCRHLRVFGRLAPGSTPDRASDELNALIAGIEQQHPDDYHQAGTKVTRLGDVFLGPVRPVLLALWGGVIALLLVACGNVAHMLLLRGSERAQEIAVRTALGVTRARLVRQFLTEAILLAGAGGLAGLLLGWGAIRLVAAEGPAQIPRLADVALSGEAVLAAGVLTLMSGLFFGMIPLRHVIRHSDSSALRSGSRGTDSATAWRARALLVTANVAMAVLLLVGAGLLVRSLGGLLSISPGFDPSGVLTMQVWATGDRFRQGETADQVAAGVRFYDDLLERARHSPGVTHASAVTSLPLGGDVDGYGFHVQGRAAARPEAAPSADRFVVTPGYFDTLRIPLIRGRVLDERDAQLAEPVAVVSATTAATMFGGDDPIGQRVSLGPVTARPRTVVGIVGDVRHHGLDAPVGLQVYVPQAQWVWAETFLRVLVRTTGDAAALAGPMRDIVRAVDPAQPVTGVRPYADIVAASTGTRRFAAVLLAIFAATTLVLAVVGLYGSVGVMVAQRKREIGVRLALGASASGIRRLVLAQGLRPVAAGLFVGVVVAANVVQLLDSMLFGIDALDPATFAAGAIVLGLFAAGACLIPARRASRIDPIATLRD
jgi:putative ABC transport system permease protein